MARPFKRYVILNSGKAEPVIYNGKADAALRVSQLQAFDFAACLISFKTQLAAEEFIAWWQYDREA